MPAPVRVSVVAPPARIIDAREARQYLGPGADAAVLDAMLAAAQARIEPPNSVYGRAFGLQTLEMTISADQWCAGRIPLRYPEIRSVRAIRVRAADGAEHELPAALWDLDGDTIVSSGGGVWPVAADRAVVGRVIYEAGFITVPEPVKIAVVLLAQHMMSLTSSDPLVKKEVTEGVGSTEWERTPAATAVLSQAVDHLLMGYRVAAGV